MKILSFISIIFITTHSIAQFSSGYGWVVPRASQKAKITQTVGVTDIEIIYSRPMVNNREVWGKLIPYEKVWRAGANECTTISFSTDVIINNNEVKSGKYALFIIPKESEKWTFILNKINNQWGAFTYNKDHDVLRTDVDVQTVPTQESVLYDFAKLYSDSTVLTLTWHTKQISIPIATDNSATTKLATQKMFDWQAGFFAAQYFMELPNELDEALKWAEASIAIDTNLSNLNQKATILAKMEKWDKAIETGEEVLEMAKKKNSTYFITSIEKRIKEWKRK